MYKSAIAIPHFVREQLANTPKSGDGLHNWLFKTARSLHPYRTEEEIYNILLASTHDCGRYVPEREILQAIQNSRTKERQRILYRRPKLPPGEVEQPQR